MWLSPQCAKFSAMENTPKTNALVPIAIIVAGILVAGAIYFKGGALGGQVGAVNEAFNPDPLKNMSEITETDWLRGDPEAPIKIVEYSDLECPFCKRFHETMNQIFDEYGAEGKVAWVYRHFPLDQLHKKARPEAEATECAGKLGGNTVFWQFTDKIFETTTSNDGLDLSLLPKFAEELGLDRATFEQCLQSEEIKSLVETDYQEAIEIGGRGTPYPIIIAPNGEKAALQGAVPFEDMKKGIDALLANQ